MITGREPTAGVAAPGPESASRAGGVTRAEQEARAGHRAVTVWIHGSAEMTDTLERLLFDAGRRVHALRGVEPAHLAGIARHLNDAGVMVLVRDSGDVQLRDTVRQATGSENFIEVPAEAVSGDVREAAIRIQRLLGDEAAIPGQLSAS
jgi:adenylylsulfate kinase-like enzyme